LNAIHEGEICHFSKSEGGRGFGFIRFDQGRNRSRIYFNLADVSPDNLGRTTHARIIGSPVRFRMQKYTRNGEPAVKAAEVCAIFPTDVPEPESHRECAVVETIVRGSVFLRRESGDQLHLCRSGVADDHRHRFDELRVGDHIWCGVQPPTDSRHSNWSAVDARFYSPQEEVEIRRTTQEVATAEAALAEEE
jgi:hypothetical protein